MQFVLMADERKSLSILFVEFSFAIVFVAAVIVVRFHLRRGATQVQSLCSPFQRRRRRSNTYDFVNLLTYRHGNVVDKWIFVLFIRQ